jgi:hypothetical protein
MNHRRKSGRKPYPWLTAIPIFSFGKYPVAASEATPPSEDAGILNLAVSWPKTVATGHVPS